MRRTSIAFALSALLLVSICSAQQTSTSDNKHTNPGQSASPAGIEPSLTGAGTTNYIASWTSSSNLGNSAIYQASSGNIGIGITTPGNTLDVNGGINAAKTYQIGENSVVSIGSSLSAYNLFLGVGAGASNAAGQGVANTFSGTQAGLYNTAGSLNTFSGFLAGASNTTGGSNTFSGAEAGYSNTTGNYNAFYGGYAGFYNTGSDNTFSGSYAGYSNTTGYYDTFSGYQAGYSNTTGLYNTFSGWGAGYYNTTGYYNTFSGAGAGSANTTGYYNTISGYLAGYNNATGSFNTFYGWYAGWGNRTGSSDIYIGNLGAPAESNTIRIGTQGTGSGQQNVTYIAGIYGSTSSGSIPVYVNSNGQLGTGTSSRRFKEQIADMGDSTNALMKLRPVTFLYKPEYANGDRTLQYGLIAEEVANVYPELVAYDKDGQPYTVRYQYLTTMLLNEVQKQYRRAEAQAKVITAQEQKINELEQRLSRLETLVGAQVKIAESLAPSAATR
jgi:trimeric autotransporter adhesin